MEKTVTHKVIFFFGYRTRSCFHCPGHKDARVTFEKSMLLDVSTYLYSSHDIEHPFHGLLSLAYSLSMQWALSRAYSLKKSIIHLILAIIFSRKKIEFY
jgi:hypothetical protein